MKTRSPFLEGGAGALLCCLSQPCPPAAFPADRSWEQGAGAAQTPRPHRQQGGAGRLQLAHRELAALRDVGLGDEGAQELGKGTAGPLDMS